MEERREHLPGDGNCETKEQIEGEILYAIRSFHGDLRCLAAAATSLAADRLVLLRVQDLIEQLDRAQRRIEETISDSEQLTLKFPGW